MRQTKPHPVTLLLMTLAINSWPCTFASDNNGGKPLVTPILKDASTSLYTIPIKDSHPLVLDLAGPLVWSTCDASHQTFELYDPICMVANQHTLPKCWMHDGHGKPFASTKCLVHPYNPLTGKCAVGDLTRIQLSASATDGQTQLYPVALSAFSSCAPDTLLSSLPVGAAGVAGLSQSELALPTQVASTQKVAKIFALCLPRGGQGAAIFGGGPFHLLPPWLGDISPEPTIPFERNLGLSQGYFFKAKGISVNQEPVPLNVNEFVIELSTTAPYTALRPDVYRALVHAYDVATSGYARITPPVAPFEICYDLQKFSYTRVGYGVPQIDLLLEGGGGWTIFSANSFVEVNDRTACLAFVQMTQTADNGPTPAMLMGGHMMEDNLLVFDLEKGKLGISGLLWWFRTNCANFNFTGTT